MNLQHIMFITEDGRVVTLSEPDAHVLQLEVTGQVIARFTPEGINIENVLKEVKPIGKEN